MMPRSTNQLWWQLTSSWWNLVNGMPDEALLAAIRLKPVRTLSGVTTVTVLTKPYPCPGKCIFCPDDIRMPKSYLPDEPGAMRAVEHNFDPYSQVRLASGSSHCSRAPNR